MRNFVLSVKRPQVRSLVVRKKKIKNSDLKNARGGGFQPVHGIVTGAGIQITFILEREKFDKEPGGGKTQVLKKFLKEMTGDPLKPSYEIVDTLPPIPFDEEDLQDPLIKKFMALEPVITQICDAHPESAGLVQATQTMIRQLLLDPDTHSEAAPKIEEFMKYLSDLKEGKPNSPTESNSSQTSSSSPDTPTAETVVEEAKPLGNEKTLYEKHLNIISKKTLQCLKQNKGDVSKMRAWLAAAKEKGEAGEYQKAIAILDRLDSMCETARKGSGPSDTDAISKGIVEKRKFLIERWQQIPPQLNVEVGKLKKCHLGAGPG